jgi:hypothetical protein
MELYRLKSDVYESTDIVANEEEVAEEDASVSGECACRTAAAQYRQHAVCAVGRKESGARSQKTE